MEDHLSCFGYVRGGVFSVPASGGDPIAVTKLDADQISHHWPAWLPDQKHFLYRAGRGAIYRGSIAGDPPIRLFDSDAKAEFVPPSTVLFHERAVRQRPAHRLDVRELGARPEHLDELGRLPVHLAEGGQLRSDDGPRHDREQQQDHEDRQGYRAGL